MPSQPSAHSVLARAVRTKQIIHIQDYQTGPDPILDRDPFAVAAADSAWHSHKSERADAQGRRADRSDFDFSGQKSGPSLKSKSNSSQVSPAKTVIAIENTRLLNGATSPFSSKPPLPTCSKSSVARPSIYRRCSIRWSSRPSAFAISDHAGLFRREGEVYRKAAGYGLSKEGHERIKQYHQASAFTWPWIDCWTNRAGSPASSDRRRARRS